MKKNKKHITMKNIFTKLWLILLVSLLMNKASTIAQTRIIVGKVLDSITKEPIIGAYIRSSENYGVISKKNGIFNLSTPLKNHEILTIKSLGYYDANIPYTVQDTFIIYLRSKSYDLDQVIVYSSANKLLQKAIHKIPQNYLSKPFQVKAFKRIYNVTTENNYFYQSDAIFDVYYPGYHKNDDQTRVFLLMNKTIANRAPVGGPRWIGYWSVPDFILHPPIYLDPKQFSKFKYQNKGKTYYLGKRVFEIQFSPKDSLKSNSIRNGIIYLDTANLAFVGFNVFYGRIEKSGFIPIDLKEDLITYQELNKKWYLNFGQITSQHEISNEPTYLVDFKVLQIDTTHPKKYKDEEILNYSNLSNFEVRREGNFDSLLAIYIPNSLDATLNIRNINNNNISVPKTNEGQYFNQFGQTDQQSYYAIRNLDFSKIDTSLLNKSTAAYAAQVKFINKLDKLTPKFHITLAQVLPYSLNNEPVYNFLGIGLKYAIYKNLHIVFRFNFNINVNNSNYNISGTDIGLSYIPKFSQYKKFYLEPTLRYSSFNFIQREEGKYNNIQALVGSLQFHIKIKDFRLGIEPYYNYPFSTANEVIKINNTSFGLGLNWGINY